MWLAVVGALILTGVIAFITFIYVYTLFLQVGLGGWGSLNWKEWTAAAIMGLAILALWVVWWNYIWIPIDISVSVKT